MNAKRLVLAGLFCAALSGGAWAFGIGARVNTVFYADGGVAPGWAVALSPADNFHLAGYWNFAVHGAGGEYSVFGLLADFWVANPALITSGKSFSMNVFIGPGIFADYSTLGDWGKLDFGVRLPLGVNFWFLSQGLELWLEVAPSWAMSFYPTLSLGNAQIPLSLGFRFWIRQPGRR